MSWDGAFSGGGKFGLTDQENAIGGGTVIGIGKLTLEKVGESRVRVSGTVSHRLDDKYDFGKGDIGQNELLPAGIVAGDPFLSRERITRVEAAGGAKKFDIESTSWRRELSGELTFKGDKVIGTNFDWNDID